MKFSQRTTKRALCLPQMLCVSLMFLVHFAIPIVKRLVWQTLPLHQHFIIGLIICGVFFVCTYLVVLRRRGHEEYRGYPVEALKPLLPLGPLPSNIHHLKGNLFDDKVVLDNPFSRLPRKQNVLLAGNIALKKEMRTLSCKVKSTECASDLTSHYDSPVVQYDPSYPGSIWPTHSADKKERIHYSRDTDLSHLIRIKQT